MSLPPIPTKTALGQEEMRRRTGGLGQRHRTILFLVDGRRPLSEVLSLAQKAGAATHHFEDLVRMGFVELPAEEPPAPPPEAPELPARAEITELALEVTPEAQAEAGDTEPAGARDAPDVSDAADAGDHPPVASPPPFAAVVPLPRAEPPPAPAAVVPLVRGVPLSPPPPAPVAAPPGARMEMPASVNFDAVASLPDRPFLPPSRTAPPPPAAPLDEQPVLEQARAQLQETLRCDPQPASARLAERVRLAQGASELIEVVWTMERGLHHYQRSHRGLVALQRARELLGLGNTLVDEDSQPSRLEDDDW